MAQGSNSPAPGGGKPGGHGWRRLALAVPISLLMHLMVLLLARPDYRPVSDFAVEMEVLEMAEGPPGGAEPEPPAAEPEPPAPEPAEELPQEELPTLDDPSITAGEIVDDLPDAGAAVAAASDSGAADAGGQAVDGGTGEGSGICMHDLFPYAQEDPSWLLWLSMSSFRETVFQTELAATLSSFALYKKMAGVTGMDPGTEVEGLLVTATDAFDWRTFRVVATYDSGEERLRGQLESNRGQHPAFSWNRTSQGYEGALPGQFRWHMVGSGRVLAVTHEPRGPKSSPSGGPPLPPPPPPNPYVDQPPTAADSGPAPTADGGADAGPSAEPELPPPSYPDWPRQVGCLTEVADEPVTGVQRTLESIARSYLGPDPEGHWPVAMLATRDPRAVGLASSTDLPVRFRYALGYAYFSDPIRIEGRVRFDGRVEEIAVVETMWRKMIRQAASDPFLKIAGLRGVFEGLELESQGNEIRFTLPLTKAQIQAALLFIQLQGDALERRTLRRQRPQAPPQPPKPKK
jgi:hypothetical protein